MELPQEAAHNVQPYKRQAMSHRRITMSRSSPSDAIPAIKFEYLNWLATDPLARDQTQSHRLHEPAHLTSTIDPAYQDTPLNHPNLRLPYPAADDDDRGG